MARATKAEIARRIDELRPLVVECLSLREIRAATVKGTSWGASVSEAQLKRYVARAREQMRDAAVIDRQQEIGAAKLRYERIIAKSAAKGDLGHELAAATRICDLYGLDEPKRSELSHSGEIDITLARKILKEELAGLIAEGSYEPDES